MTQKYANRSLFIFVCGSSLNLAIATTTIPTTTMFFFPCLFSTSLWHGSVPMNRTVIAMFPISHMWEPCWMAQFSVSFSTSLWHGCAHGQELRLSCYQIPICGDHVEWHSSLFPISFCNCFLDLNQLWWLSDSQLTGISLMLVKQCLCK